MFNCFLSSLMYSQNVPLSPLWVKTVTWSIQTMKLVEMLESVPRFFHTKSGLSLVQTDPFPSLKFYFIYF
jgi:hypothetical protein